MDDLSNSGNNGDNLGYGGVSGEGSKNDPSFEMQFRNMVVAPNQGSQYAEYVKPEGGSGIQKTGKNKIIIPVMAILATIGAIGLVIAVVAYVGALAEKRNNEELEESLAVDEQDDTVLYKDLDFNAEGDSDVPILVYTAAKNGETIKAEWLEEFRAASVKYNESYSDRAPIPREATFGSVTVVGGLNGELYPNVEIRRFLIETSGGCARFDFYDDLLTIYDYEFLKNNCDEAEWDFLSSEEAN